MIIDIALLLIAIGNLLTAICILNSSRPKAVEVQTMKPVKKKLKIKKSKPVELTKEEKLFYNLEVFDGTDKGQMEI